MKIRFSAGIPPFALLVIAACRGQTLDLGHTDGGAATSSSGSSGGTGTAALQIDDVVCTDVTSTRSAEGSAWHEEIGGTCGRFGSVTGVVDSRSELTYPQNCGGGTALRFTIGGAALEPITSGCAIMTGPTTAAPNRPLVFHAKVGDEANPRVVAYHAPGVRPHDPNVCNIQSTEPERVHATLCSLAPTYDGGVGPGNECRQDSDCSRGPCLCAIPEGTAFLNKCMANSNCKEDSDCPSQQRCLLSDPLVLTTFPQGPKTGTDVSPADVNHAFTEAYGAFCTTPEDTCCPRDTANPSLETPGWCVYDLDHAHWSYGFGP